MFNRKQERLHVLLLLLFECMANVEWIGKSFTSAGTGRASMHKYDLVSELINVKNESNESINKKKTIINLCIK